MKSRVLSFSFDPIDLAVVAGPQHLREPLLPDEGIEDQHAGDEGQRPPEPRVLPPPWRDAQAFERGIEMFGHRDPGTKAKYRDFRKSTTK